MTPFSTAKIWSDKNPALIRNNALRIWRETGVDAEIIFPNKGLAMWATPDPQFAMAQCKIYNDWAWEVFGKYNDRMSPMACLATGDLENSIAEVKRVAKMDYRGLTLP